MIVLFLWRHDVIRLNNTTDLNEPASQRSFSTSGPPFFTLMAQRFTPVGPNESFSSRTNFLLRVSAGTTCCQHRDKLLPWGYFRSIVWILERKKIAPKNIAELGRNHWVICSNDFKSKEMFQELPLPPRYSVFLLQRLNLESQAEGERNSQIGSAEIINNTFTFLTSTPSRWWILFSEFCSETKKCFTWKCPQPELSLFGFYHLQITSYYQYDGPLFSQSRDI